MTETQKSELGRAIVLSRYKPSYVSNWLKKTNLLVDDAIYALQLVEEEEVQLKTIDTFLSSGYSLSQFCDLVQWKKTMEDDISITFKRMPSGIYNPDLSDFISYDSLLFLDFQTGNTHDLRVIYDTIFNICELLDASDIPYGIGELIHRIRDVCASDEGIGFGAALFKGLNKLPGYPLNYS